jgi:hypothetical protein
MRKPKLNSSTIDFESFLDLLHGAKKFSHSCGASEYDDNLDIDFFDNIIEELAPAITLSQYRQVRAKVLNLRIEKYYGYYEDTYIDFIHSFSTRDLYNALSEFNLTLKKLKEPSTHAKHQD